MSISLFRSNRLVRVAIALSKCKKKRVLSIPTEKDAKLTAVALRKHLRREHVTQKELTVYAEGNTIVITQARPEEKWRKLRRERYASS